MPIREQVYGFYIPTVTLMGIGAHKELGSRIKTLGAKKPLIVTDKGITRTGLTEKIADLVRKDAGLEPVIFDETVPNPTDKNVHDGVEVFKKNGCDMIITLGGGSPHDCGKGIGLVVSNGGMGLLRLSASACRWKDMPAALSGIVRVTWP